MAVEGFFVGFEGNPLDGVAKTPIYCHGGSRYARRTYMYAPLLRHHRAFYIELNFIELNFSG
jgi:hypothetical protein